MRAKIVIILTQSTLHLKSLIIWDYVGFINDEVKLYLITRE